MLRRGPRDSGGDESAAPPAKGYYAVMSVLPAEMMVAMAPPPTGTRVVVTGSDAVATHWYLDTTTASYLMSTLKDAAPNVGVAYSAYDDRSNR